MNVIVRVEFEFAYNNVTVQHIKQNTTEDST